MASRLPRNRKVTIYSLWELLSNIHAKVKGNQWLDQLSSQGAKDTGRKFSISAAKENPILSKLFWTKQTSSVLESDKIPIRGELLIRKNSMLSVISDNPLTFPGLSEKSVLHIIINLMVWIIDIHWSRIYSKLPFPYLCHVSCRPFHVSCCSDFFLCIILQFFCFLISLLTSGHPFLFPCILIAACVVVHAPLPFMTCNPCLLNKVPVPLRLENEP